MGVDADVEQTTLLSSDLGNRPLADNGLIRSLSRLVRIVHAAETSSGGIATYVSQLIRMQRTLFGPGAITVFLPQSQHHYLVIPEGVEVVIFDDSSSRLRNSFRLAAALKEFARKGCPDVVHLHSTFAGAVLRPMILNLRGRSKIIYCPHGWAFDRRMSSYGKYGAKWVERRLSHLCDAIVCISYHEIRAARLCGIAASKLALIRNGVPTHPPLAAVDPKSIEWPPGRRRILFVGRFDKQKGVDVLLAAMEQLGDSAFACIVGNSVVGDLAMQSMPDNVRLCGWLSSAHLEAFYQSAEVVVIPSRWEGFGLVAVEAMRAGLPVIASDVGGLKEIIDNGVTGLTIAPDDPNLLAETLREASDSQLRAMGKAGRERFLREFTMERTHRELCRLYFEPRSAELPELLNP